MDWFLYDNRFRHERVKRHGVYIKNLLTIHSAYSDKYYIKHFEYLYVNRESLVHTQRYKKMNNVVSENLCSLKSFKS